MATTANTTFSRMMKTLRENGNGKEKREVLTYITSQAKKLEANGVIKEEKYKELCRVVIEIISKYEGSIQNEALSTLNAIVREFQAHSINLFEAMLPTDRRTRVKILKLLEVVDDNAISAASKDGQALNFFKDCMLSVQPNFMEWITPTACVDNLQKLTEAEQQQLSDDEKLEEYTISYSIILLHRLYKLAATTFESHLNIQRFDTLLLDQIITLAYMGHKRQRGPALKLLQQAVAINISSRISEDYPDLWAAYKENLQNVYCNRMLLLVTICDPDWTIQWNTTIQFLGTDLHRGACLINNLLSVEEKAFKSMDPIIRRQAFLSWKLLIDNFALDNQELATARRIKLLCIPLNAKNSKTELIALTKLEVWWHLIIKLYKDIAKFATPIISQFLNYCFGPLGDTPLLSAKFEIVASPGKRFYKTKLVAVDALYQLIVKREDIQTVCTPILEEKLPNSISDAVFQECSKSIIHSIGEAILILGQHTDEEMKNRFRIGKQLWTSLMTYIRDTTLRSKGHLYKNVILVVTELGNYIKFPMVKNMIFEVILPHVFLLVKDHDKFHDNALPELVLKFLSFPMLEEMPKYLLDDTNDLIKCLLKRCISSEFTYSSGVFGFLETIMENLKIDSKERDMIVYLNLWIIIAEILTKYLQQSDNNKNKYQFKNVKLILAFPFQIATLKKLDQIQEQMPVWKALYKQLVLQLDSKNNIKPNEILFDTATMMQDCLKMTKNCCSLIVNCFDTLLSTLDYEFLLKQDEIPSILLLILDVITISFHYIQDANIEASLKTLSALLITIFGHNSEKVVFYLHRCKPVIELMLTLQTKTSVKEIVNTWGCIISILKGLNKPLNYDLLLSYKNVIITAMRHNISDIRFLTQSIFEISDGLDNSAKCILDEIRKVTEKPVSHSKSDITKKKTEEAKEVRMAGSFLNRKSSTILMLKPLPNINHQNNLSKKTDKNAPEPEPDSQDYVYIKTDLKFDVNRLTEHQKETLKKKREDIPALYNDLSQSSSQNSQNLQEWFDIKTKSINELDEANNKKSDITTHEPIDNGLTIDECEIKTKFSPGIIDHIYSKRLDENVEENIVDTNQNKNIMKKNEKEGLKKKQDKKMDTSKKTGSTSASLRKQAISEALEKIVAEFQDEKKPVAKKLNFESREEFPENKMYERELSPSMLDSNKRRHRNNVTKFSSSLKSDEIIGSQKDQSTLHIQKTLKVKIPIKIISPEKFDKENDKKKKSVDDIEVKDNANESKKGVKRKYMSDTESDGIMQRRKRKLIREDGGETSRDVFSDIDMDNATKRTKNEISRLKINMKFNSPPINRRRVKHSDDEKETTHKSRKCGTSEYRQLKLKLTDTRCPEGYKKSSKSEKNADDHDQGLVVKKRGRRSKQEANKNDLNKEHKEIKKSDNTSDKVPESSSPMDVDMTHAAPMSDQAVQDVPTDTAQDKTLDENSSAFDANLKAELTEPNKWNQENVEDVVESSQISTVSSKLDKKCVEKSSLINVNKTNTLAVQTLNTTKMEKNYVPESIDNDESVPKTCEQSAEVNSNAEVSDERDKDSVKDAVQETENSNMKVLVPEGQKAVDNTSTIKSTSVTSFPSPKNNSKVFSKPKSFTGRAAHMLGLVTKSLVEGDSSSIALEDELSVKKSKAKDSENEMSTSKKISTVKEIDKIGGPSGSRQEKIFNNMRSHDYCALPSTFTTLKNDGEKLSFKLDKTLSDSSMEISVDKDNEDASFACEKDDLPILEWSSANPPSLTASPSASILKRHRSSIPEPDPDLTPNKRKRVSFADPPVSKEMGYEISTADSPKMTKCSMTRGTITRKDSSLKLKQTKLKLVSSDAEKVTSDAQSKIDTEDAEVERKSESLEKSSELEAMDVDEPANAPETDYKANSHVTIIEDIQIMEEIVIVAIPNDPLSTTFKDSQNSNVAPTDHIGTQDSETQQDIFDTSRDNINTSIQNSSVDSIKLNITDDSVIAALPTKDNNSANMEDTVDVQNMTDMNSTVNTDEVFCGKLMRTSTHAIENVAEQDTLPATDSMFSSLISQDTQSQKNNVEVEPEYLDSTLSIYPTLLSCVEPIDSIIGQLTYPTWEENLCAYFESRNICTIGELARLSEREVNRLPVKGKSKIEHVKSVLQRFENMSMQQANRPSESASNVTKVQRQLPVVENPSIVPITSNIEMMPKIISNTALINTPLNLPTEIFNLARNKVDNTQFINNNAGVLSESMYSGSFALPTLSAFRDIEQPGPTILIAQNPPAMSTNNVLYMQASPLTSFTNIATVSEASSSSGHISSSPGHKFRRILPRPYLTENGSEIILSPPQTYIQIREEPVVIAQNDSIIKQNEPVVKWDEPVVKRDIPVAIRDIPVVQLDESVQRDKPVIREKSVITRDESVKREAPIIIQDKVVTIQDKPVTTRHDAVITHSSVGTTTEDTLQTKKSQQVTKSVECQMTLSDLLDEIDVNLVLESAARRCSPEMLLSRYKKKMAHLNDTELMKETVRMLDLPNSHKFNELSLKSAARACGVSKVLLRLPDIFSSDKQFFEKVLNVYSKKLNINDCLNVFDFSVVKDAILQKCTSSELVEMLSEKLKVDKQEGTTQTVPTLSSLDAMLKRLPMDVIISHTVANEELIPASVVLDIALQNNNSEDIAQALAQSPVLAKRVLDKLWTSQYTIAHINNDNLSKESLLNIFNSVCSKLTAPELLNAYHEAMSSKLNVKGEKK